MQLNDKNKMVAFLISAIFFVVFDRVLKYWMLTHPLAIFEIIPGVFKLNLAKNYNIAFSIPFSGPVLNITILLIIGILGFYTLKLGKKKEYLIVGYLTNVLIGAISNIYDRLSYGFVVDYLDLKYFTVFNIADSMIVMGCLLLSFSLFKKNV